SGRVRVGRQPDERLDVVAGGGLGELGVEPFADGPGVGRIDLAEGEELAAGFDAGTDTEQPGREQRAAANREGEDAAVASRHAAKAGRLAVVADAEFGQDFDAGAAAVEGVRPVVVEVAVL